MPWQPLSRIAFAVATYPFEASSPADLPLELGDELYIIEQGGRDGKWLRGYLVAPPSLLAGLTSAKGQTLEARVFSGIFPRSCVEVREVLGEGLEDDESIDGDAQINGFGKGTESLPSLKHRRSVDSRTPTAKRKKDSFISRGSTRGSLQTLPVIKRDPDEPKPQAPVPMLNIGDETPTSISEPLVDEIASCLREWHSTNIHELLLAGQYPMLDRMHSLVKRLDLSRRQFLHSVLTSNEMRALREKTVWDLVKGNKLMGGEVIVRDPAERGRVLTGDDSAVEMTKLQSMMSLLSERPKDNTDDLTTLHHLLLNVKAFVGASTESTTLVFYLASRNPGSKTVELSESYIVDMPPNGAVESMPKSGQMRTLFADLGASDIGEVQGCNTELYLVVKIRSSQLPLSNNASKDPNSRNGVGSRDSGKSSEQAPLTSTGTAKGAGRRSLMWASSKAQRSGFSRNGQRGRLNSLAESTEDETEGQSSRPPSTTSSSRRSNASPDAPRPSPHQLVNRTVGIGALRIDALMRQGKESEHVINIWTTSISYVEDHLGGDWVDVIPDLFKSGSGAFQKSRKAERLHVSLKPFTSPDADAMIKATPTLLAGVAKTDRIGFAGAPTKPRSDIYVTLDKAWLPRNALLARAGGAAIPMAATTGTTNLQLTLEVRKASGDRIENCIYGSSNTRPTSSWESTAADRDEQWNQTIRLAIPAEDVTQCHLVMVLSDVPHQPFAICHLPLWDGQAFRNDGHHSLLLYKYDDTTWSARPSSQGKGGYLQLPWSSRGKDYVPKDEIVTGPIALLKMRTYLCSTRISQDKNLLNLIRWKDNPGQVPDILKQITFVPEIEIVKLLGDVLDALFSILVENSGNDDLEDMVFSALVTLLSIIHDRRFNLAPLIDDYAENRFNHPYASACLVRSFSRLLIKPADPETSRKLRATFKVVQQILMFITHARGQQKAKEAGIGITGNSPGFTRHLKTIFKSLDGLMRSSSPILVGSQTLAVQHFHTWLPELSALLSPEEILHIAIDFMDSCALVKGKLVLYKLILIINYSRLDLFSQPEQRKALSTNTVRWIAPHWGKTDTVDDQYRDQVRLCCSVVANQAGFIGPEIPDYVPKVLDSYLAIQAIPRVEKERISLLFPTQYPFPSKPIQKPQEIDEALIELSAVLATISTLPAGMQLELVAEDEIASLLEKTLEVHLSILHCEAFPSNWLSVHIYHHKSTMRMLQYLAGILLESFVPEPDNADDYNTGLWKLFFSTLLKLIGSDSLALETFPEQKRRAVWKIAGDVREHGADLLRRTWEAIGWETSPEEEQAYNMKKMGGYQVQYVPALVGPIVELCLSVHEGLRRVAVEVLQSMIISEWNLTEDLSVIQTEMVDSLDRLCKSKPMTESVLQKLFIGELLELFKPLSEQEDGQPLYTAVKDLVMTVDELLELLVAVHSSSTVEASQMIHRMQLMDFLRDLQKEHIFIRYVHQLANLQANARNPAEAGLALRLHADLYDWDPSQMLDASVEPCYPVQSHFERKERIYFDMIKHFEEGEAWGSALTAYKELATQYESNTFDFPKLARTQRAIASIYETIGKAERLVPKYFRVAYKGLGFPQHLRDQEFIFEGVVNEKMIAFIDRLQEQHPNSQVVTYTGDYEEIEGQFLQVSPVNPHRDHSHQVYQRTRVPQGIREYLLSSNPRVFSATTYRSTQGPVAEHWMEKMVYTVAEPFPTILRRSEVVSVDKVKLEALPTAIERVTRKTSELAALDKQLVDGQEDSVPLLISTIEAQVLPGSEPSVSRYRELIPTASGSEEEEEEEVELKPLESALKMSLLDHAIVMKRALTTLARSTNSQLRAKFDELIPHFEASFAPELAMLNPIPNQSRDASPLPTWTTQNSLLSAANTSGPPPLSATAGTFETVDTAILAVTPDKTKGSRLSFLKRSTTGEATSPSLNKSPNNTSPALDSIAEGANGSIKQDSSRRSFFGGTTGTLNLGLTAAQSINGDDHTNSRNGSLSNGNGHVGGGGSHTESKPHVGFTNSASGGTTGTSGSYETMKSGMTRSQTNGESSGDWVTESGVAITSPGRRSRGSSFDRKESFSQHEGRMRGMRKRLSFMNLGKKASRQSVVHVNSLAEED